MHVCQENLQYAPSVEKWHLLRNKKKPYVEAKAYRKDESSFCTSVKKEKDILSTFALHFKLQVTPTVYNTCLIKMERHALSFYKNKQKE